jgi:hypothetical protein
VNVRKSTSLTAGLCSLCITASIVTATPQAAAAQPPAVQHRTVSVVEQPYVLTASTQQIIEDLLVVAGLPAYNIYTTVNALGGLTIFVTNTNKALGSIFTGQWGQIPTYLEAAVEDERKAIEKLTALPQTLIDYNTTAIQNLLDSLGGGGSTVAIASAAAPAAATPSAAAASTPEVLSDLLVVAGLPIYNIYTTVNALGGLTVFVTNTNKALGSIFTGQWGQIPTYLEAAVEDERKAIEKLTALPQTLIDYNTTAIQNLLDSLGGGSSATATIAPSSRVQPLTLPAAAPQAQDVAADHDPVIDTEVAGVAAATAAEVTTDVEAEDTSAAEVEKAELPKTAAVTEAKDEAGAKTDASEPDTDAAPTEKPADKPDTADAEKQSDDDKGDLKSGVASKYGKDDAADSTSSAATGADAESKPGRHRKPDAKSGASTTSSTGGSDSSE